MSAKVQIISESAKKTIAKWGKFASECAKKKTYLERADLTGSEVSMLLQKYEHFLIWQKKYFFYYVRRFMSATLKIGYQPSKEKNGY